MTVVDSSTEGASEHHRFISIIESKGIATEIGFAFLDLDSGSCLLGQFSDSPAYSGLARQMALLEPDVVILGSTATEDDRLCRALEGFGRKFAVEVVQDNSHGLAGAAVLADFCTSQKVSHLLTATTRKFYLLTAVASLFHHLSTSRQVLLRKNSINFQLSNGSDMLCIDYYSVRNLELVPVKPMADSAAKHKFTCLLDCINRTVTPLGKRLLRRNILQPFCDEEAIISRHALIKYFLKEKDVLQQVRNVLSRLPDIDQSLARIIKVPGSGGDPKQIVGILRTIHSICVALELSATIIAQEGVVDADAWRPIKERMCEKDLGELRRVIETSINTEVLDQKRVSDYQLCYLMRSGLMAILDVSRRTLEEQTQDIIEYTSALSAKLGLELRVKYSNTHRYIIQGKLIEKMTADNVFFKIGASGYTTTALLKLNERIRESMDEIISISGRYRLVEQLAATIVGSCSFLWSLSEALAELDVVASFAEYALQTSACIPVFSDAHVIVQGYHPILLEGGRPTTPLSFDACDGENFIVVSGNNMSGKSTYCKQVALFQIMGQIGSPVPAEEACLPLYRKVLSRLGSDDDLESNASTFTVEMREAAFILEEVGPRSLVLIDELGRGSSNLCGISIATAISERLVRSAATVLFVTHFARLIEYLETFPNVKRVALFHDGSSGGRKLEVGRALTTGRGGLELLGRLGFASEIVAEATEMLAKIDRSAEGTAYKRKIVAAAEKRRETLRSAMAIAKVLLCEDDLEGSRRRAQELQDWIDGREESKTVEHINR